MALAQSNLRRWTHEAHREVGGLPRLETSKRTPARQDGTQRIALDGAEHAVQVLVLLDGKGFAASFPDVATAVVVAVITPHVQRHQPLHPATRIAIMARPEHQVKMLGHETVA